MHSHPEPADGLLLLAAGVTGVRDMAAEPAKRERMKTWETDTLGPRIVYAGIVDGPGPFQGPTQVLVANEAEARAAVDAMADAGFILVKIYSSVKPELVPILVDEARKRGLRVGGHIPAGHDGGARGARRLQRNPAHEHAVPQLHVRPGAGHAHAGAADRGRRARGGARFRSTRRRRTSSRCSSQSTSRWTRRCSVFENLIRRPRRRDGDAPTSRSRTGCRRSCAAGCSKAGCR